VNNLWAGIFIELGWGPLTVDNNVIGYTRSGDGVYSHDSSDVTLAHNLLFANAGFGAWFQVTGKRMLEGKLTEASHERILNNLVLGNHVGAIGLPVDSERGNDNASEGNLIGPGSSSGSRLSGYGLFSIHSNGSNIEQAEMERAYRKIFNGVPPDERPGKANWINRPIVGLQEWRTFTGRDLHSFVSRMPGYLDRPMLRSAALEVDLGVDESLSQVSCSAINGIEYDYFGARIPSCAQPGPFQGLNNGLNRISLWPQSRRKPR